MCYSLGRYLVVREWRVSFTCDACSDLGFPFRPQFARRHDLVGRCERAVALVLDRLYLLRHTSTLVRFQEQTVQQDKRLFANARAAIGRTLDWVKSLLQRPSAPASTPRKQPKFLHVSRPIVEEGDDVRLAGRGVTYRRPELRRHELRKLKKQGLDLTGSTGTRGMESLL